MSSSDVGSAVSAEAAEPGTVDMKLEVVTLPVADVERAKSFYLSLGWRLDADLNLGGGAQVVQITPPHSQCSIHFGTGLTTAEPGSAQRLILAVDDIQAARAALVSRGVEVGEVFDSSPPPGTFPGQETLKEHSYSSYAPFSDPDGNGWLLQEITTRLPGREWED